MRGLRQLRSIVAAARQPFAEHCGGGGLAESLFAQALIARSLRSSLASLATMLTHSEPTPRHGTGSSRTVDRTVDAWHRGDPVADSEHVQTPAADASALERVMFEVKRVIVGQERLVERLI